MHRQNRHQPALAPALAILALALLGAPRSAIAADPTDEEAPVYAVQNREFVMKSELHAGIGTLPVNAYFKGFTIGGGFTYHFSPMWAWEIAQFQYSFPFATSLKHEIEEQNKLTPTQEANLHYFGSSSLVFKPAYGKFALGNRYVVHMEGFLVLGPSVGVFAPRETWAAGLEAGGGLRFFINDVVSVRLDLRDVTYFTGDAKAGNAGKTNSDLYLGLSLAINLPGRRSYRRVWVPVDQRGAR